MNDGLHPVVVSIGSINADFQVRIAEQPDPGQVRVAHDFVRLGGGKAGNVSFLAARLGVPSVLHGRVGDDDLAEQALRPLREIGVDLDGVSVAADRATGVAMITVLPDGRKTIVLAENANDTWSRGAVERMRAGIAAAPAGSVLVCDYEISASVVDQAVEAAAGRGMEVVVDPSPAQRVETGTLRQATAIVPNAAEAEALTGIHVDGVEAAAEAARAIAVRDGGMVCVKLADGGCVVREGDRAWAIPSVPVPVVDTTGAGDAFAGGLAVGLLEAKSAVASACIGVAASHIAVTAYGSQPAYPGREAIVSFLPRLAGKVRELHG